MSSVGTAPVGYQVFPGSGTPHMQGESHMLSVSVWFNTAVCSPSHSLVTASPSFPSSLTRYIPSHPFVSGSAIDTPLPLPLHTYMHTHTLTHLHTLTASDPAVRRVPPEPGTFSGTTSRG